MSSCSDSTCRGGIDCCR